MVSIYHTFLGLSTKILRFFLKTPNRLTSAETRKYNLNKKQNLRTAFKAFSEGDKLAKHRRSKPARKVKGFGKISFFVLILTFAIFTALLVTAAVHMPKKSGNTVCIDAGHGGYDVGATNGERYEKDDNLRLAKAVESELKARGINTIMTRSDDTYVSLEDRCKTANKKKADLFISLHRNSADSGCGFEIWTLKNSPQDDLLLAENIMESLGEVGLSKNRGVKGGIAGNGNNYYVNKNTDMPSCLAEMGFITDDGDNALFDKNLQSYAAAIADAVETTLGEIKK